MHESKGKPSNWQEQIETTSFTEIGEGMSEGTQFRVYSTPDLDFVVKVPIHEAFLIGYRVAQKKAVDLTVPFSIGKGVSLKIDGQGREFDEVIIQKKVSNAQDEFQKAVDSKDSKTAARLVAEIGRADRILFNRGVFIADPAFTNAGIMRDGSVKFTDAGSFAELFENDEIYTSLARSRAATHLSMAILFDKHSTERLPLRGVYEKSLRFKIPYIPGLGNFTEIGIGMFDINKSGILARMGEEEFKRFAPNGAPFEVSERALSLLVRGHD